MSYTTVTTCRVCGEGELVSLYSLGEQYVSNFVEQGSIHRGATVVPIDIDMCQHCHLLQARHTAPNDLLYSRHYWYRSGVTKTMREALRDVVGVTLRNVTLNVGDVVVDIGSNDG